MNKLEEFSLKIQLCRQDGFLTMLLQDIFKDIGVSSFIFLTLLQDSKNRDSYRYHIGCNPNFFNIYNSRKWHAIDPFIAHAKKVGKPILIDELKRKILDESQSQKDFFYNLSEYGFKAGIIIPAYTASNKRMGLLIAGNDDCLDGNLILQRNRVTLRAIASELLDWWVVKLQSKAVDVSKLKTEDLQLLKLAYFQNTASDMALSLGLTTSQVNNKFRVINELFDVDNKKDAADIAMEYGIITVF